MIEFKKALLVRLDRIGDLILTLPIDQLSFFKGKAFTWVVNKDLEYLVKSSLPHRDSIGLSRPFSFRDFLGFLSYLKQEKFDLAIVFHAPWWVNLALLLARIKFRIGVKSQWHSILFLNRGIRQKRSRSLFHESDYNRQLVELGIGGILINEPMKPVQLSRETTSSLDLPFENYIVVHPGMGGSARNWPVENYAELILELLKKGNVILTGSPSDRVWVEPVFERVGQHPGFQKMELTRSEDWVKVLTNANAVLVPSTGTAHVSASLGARTVGIYSPVKVQAATRWAPRGLHVKILTPEVDCPAHFKCLGANCPRYDCMRDITVEEVRDALSKLS